MKVTIKTLNGKMFEVALEPEMLVSEAKVIVAAASPDQSFTTERQKLIYSGKVMDNTKTLSEYAVADKGFIVCMLSKVTAATAAAAAPPYPNAAAQQPALPGATASTSMAAPVPTLYPDEDEDDDDEGEDDDEEEDYEEGDEEEGEGGEGMEAMMAHLMQLNPEDVANLVGVTGQPEEAVRVALQVAQGNPDVAADFLMNGMPDMEDYDDGEDYDGGEDEGGYEQYGEGGAGFGQEGGMAGGLDIAAAVAAAHQQTQQQATPLDQLRASPQFNELRQAVQSNPGMLQAVIQQISAQSPEMLAAIQGNPAAFLAMLNEPLDPAAATAATGSGGAPPAANTPTPTANLAGPFAAAAAPAQAAAVLPPQPALEAGDAAALGRLTEMGFPHDRALEALIACDHDEEAAANFLFDSM